MGDWVDEHDIYDDGLDDEACLHDDFDYDWQGEATCHHCGHQWELSAKEMEQMAQWYEEYHAMCERETEGESGVRAEHAPANKTL